MSHRKSYNIPGHAHFLTFSCWQRRHFLNADFARQTMIDCLDAARRLEQFGLWAYVIMPEHVHLVILPKSESYEIARILRRIKEPVARRVLDVRRRDGSDRMRETADTTAGPVVSRFWQPGGGYDRNLHDPGSISKAIE